MNNDNYQGYQSMVTDVVTALTDLTKNCQSLEMEGKAQELQKMSDHLKNHIFSVGIMGEFKRGKSTVINALLGQEIVPADVVPCSATLNYVRWDANKHAQVYFKDGRTEEVPVDELPNYITKITEESEQNSENVDKAVVYYPSPFCQNGVQIVDTPGLNDDERMTAISENVIPTMDAIIMVIVAQSPFSQSEAEFVRNKLMLSDLGRVIFVVNKIDLIDEDERDRLLEHIKEKIAKSVMQKMELVYGADSKEYQDALSKVGDIHLISVSAKKALKSKINNKPEMFEESGFGEFEGALSHLLTSERGILDLIHPVNTIMSTSKEALEMANMRMEAMNMDADEFEKVQNESLEELEKTREDKKEEIDSLKAKGRTLYQDMLPEVAAAYDDIANQMSAFVSQYPISESDVANEDSVKAFSAKMSQQVNSQIEGILAVHTERIQHKVSEQLGRDIAQMEQFGIRVNNSLQNIQFAVKSKNATLDSAKANIGAVVGDTVIDFAGMIGLNMLTGGALPCVGAIVSGYKEDGIKGAAVGGAAGAAVGLGTIVGIMAATGGLALPGLIIASVSSSIAGKGIRSLLFKKNGSGAAGFSASDNPVDQVRSQLYESVNASIDEIRRQNSLENWLKDTCDRMYSSMADSIDTEWENSLTSVEKSLAEIKINLQLNEEKRKNKVEELQEEIDEITKIVKSIEPIQNRLKSALENGRKENE